ncbi:hypothetical protein CRYUN_Cryun31cG0114900 [Craigia yunnanensis]
MRTSYAWRWCTGAAAGCCSRSRGGESRAGVLERTTKLVRWANRSMVTQGMVDQQKRRVAGKLAFIGCRAERGVRWQRHGQHGSLHDVEGLLSAVGGEQAVAAGMELVTMLVCQGMVVAYGPCMLGRSMVHCWRRG